LGDSTNTSEFTTFRPEQDESDAEIFFFWEIQQNTSEFTTFLPEQDESDAEIASEVCCAMRVDFLR